MINNMKDLSSFLNIESSEIIKPGTIYLLKTAFMLSLAGAALFAVLFFAGLSMILSGQTNLNIMHVLFTPEFFTICLVVFSIIMLSNSLFDTVAISVSTKAPAFSAIRYDVIKSVAMTNILVVLIAAAGIGYLPLFRSFGYDYSVGMLLWIIHAGVILFISRYTEILSIRMSTNENTDSDPFKIIYASIKIIGKNSLESCASALFELAMPIGLFAVIMQLADIYAAVFITGLIYFFVIKPISLKAAIRIVMQPRNLFRGIA